MTTLNAKEVLITATLATLRKIPHSIDSATGKRLLPIVVAPMKRYFDRLLMSFPENEVRMWLLTVVPIGIESFREQEEEEGEGLSAAELAGITGILALWLSAGRGGIVQRMAATLFGAAGVGYEQGVEEWGDFFGVPVQVTSFPTVLNSLALGGAGQLIRGVDATTRGAIIDIIESSLSKGRGIPGIVSDINNSIGELLGDARLQRIARTETNKMLSQGAMIANLAVGADTKSWITVGDDRVSQDICAPNEGDGRIRITDTFGSGHMVPPGHPNCRCTPVFFGATTEGLARAEAGIVPDIDFPENDESFEPQLREAA